MGEGECDFACIGQLLHIATLPERRCLGEKQLPVAVVSNARYRHLKEVDYLLGGDADGRVLGECRIEQNRYGRKVVAGAYIV